jgi:acyl-CoA thioester hydrolase
MPRLKLIPKETYRFRYRTTIKVRDVNYGGHLGNDAVVGLLHEARVDFLSALGFTELDLGDQMTGLILNELQVSYKKEGRLLDDIVIHSDITNVKAASFRICHLIVRGETPLAVAEVGLVAYDYARQTIAELPEAFVEKITAS